MESSRRDFLARTGLGLAAASASASPTACAQTSESASSAGAADAPRPWFEQAWRRAVIDMHIPDWDDRFLSEFKPEEYVQRLLDSRAQSVVLYAQSHVGLFNFPTKVGRQHRAWHGRNALKDLIERVRGKGIAVQLYTSVIFDRWASDEHPEWRVRTAEGKDFGPGSRFGFVCPNSPYRQYVRLWTRELCEQFDFEGLRFDMTFWPSVCYCQHCGKRWQAEVGGEMPKTVNWLDERWVAFQRKREEWLADFAALCTGTVRKHKPAATVEHQASTLTGSWVQGATALLVAQNDFLQGDFYGDALQGSFVRKLLEELTPRRPFGFETSYALALSNHTAGKSEPLLEAKASAAIADGAAFVFIDAIDPIGTVSPRAHARMGRVFDRLMPFYAHLGGERVADVAVFYSPESRISFRTNGQPASAAPAEDTHTRAAMQSARWLLGRHLPLAVITRKSLPHLDRYRVLVLSNVNAMDADEAAAIRDWVRGGGALYASGATSLVNKRGQMQRDFLLADAFGVSLKTADWTERQHYLAPTPAGQKFFPDHDAKYPALDNGFRLGVDARAGAAVLATTTLPWLAPSGDKFSSIHSNPPWTPTAQPEIVSNRFGKGRVVYCASLVETVPGLDATFVALIRSLFGEWRIEADAPPVVEVTLFHQPDRKRYVVSLVNFQSELPNVPVDGAAVRLRLNGQRVAGVKQLPDGKAIAHRHNNGIVTFTAPRLETLAMFAVELG